jgi:hypothetical protein
MKTEIYALCHPITNEIKYIGKSVRLQKRLIDHKRLCRKTKTKNNNWIQSLLSNDLFPECVVLETIEHDANDKNIWSEQEQFWISYYKYIGAELNNHTNGGEGQFGIKRSDFTKNKIREKLLYRSFSKETLEKMSLSHKGKRPWMLGKKHSEATLKKISIANSLRVVSEETRSKHRLASTGRKHSEETKLLLSELKKNRVVSEEARKNMSIAAKNRKNKKEKIIGELNV